MPVVSLLKSKHVSGGCSAQLSMKIRKQRGVIKAGQVYRFAGEN